MGSKTAEELGQKNFRTIARCLSSIENGAGDPEELLHSLPGKNIPVIGITGAPGTGKSTLVNALISEFTREKLSIAVLCVDPSSPFHQGALLGDRIRMNQWYNFPNIFIRSLSSRGALGGLHPKIFEMADLLKIAGFDYIIIETVGTGQSEVEIASLADCTVVVMIPGTGDSIQTMKSGVLEIADIFVVNKCDLPGSQKLVHDLSAGFAQHQDAKKKPAIIEAIATENKGIRELIDALTAFLGSGQQVEKKEKLLFEKAKRLILEKTRKKMDLSDLRDKLQQALAGPEFNLYRFAEKWLRDNPSV